MIGLIPVIEFISGIQSLPVIELKLVDWTGAKGLNLRQAYDRQDPFDLKNW